MYFVCVAIIAGIFTGVMALIGGLGYFFDPASVAFLFTPVLFVLLTNFSPGEILRSFRAAMSGCDAGAAELRNSLLFFRTAQKALLVVAVLGFLTGFITMAAGENDLGRFKVGFGVAILVLYYALAGIMLVTLPFTSALKKKLNRLG
jgi:hypothetical protein